MMISAAAAGLAAALAVLPFLLRKALPQDWPGWRGDPGRTADSAAELPEGLRLRWSLRLPALEPAWPDAPGMQFDAAHQPVVVGDTVYLASSLNDSVTALDAATGAERWRFLAGGPVRFAPYCWQGRVYFACDDGHLYCLDGADGRLLWKFRGAPDAGRLVLGNGRVISTWPARGAPVVAGGRVYFAAGIWPFMGVFVHALDAVTGRPVWSNSGLGALFMDQPHNSPAFSGLAPQGYLAVSGDRLFVPNGQAVAAGLRRSDGGLLFFNHVSNDRRGGYFLAARGGFFYSNNAAFAASGGAFLARRPGEPVIGREAVFRSALPPAPTAGAPPPPAMPLRWERPETGSPPDWVLTGDDAPRFWLKAGRRLYAGAEGCVMAMTVPGAPGEAPRVTWSAELRGHPAGLAAAGGRLFVSTLEGELFCFAADGEQTSAHEPEAVPVPRHADWAGRLAKLLDRAPARGGWAILLGDESPEAAAELAALAPEMRMLCLVSGPGKTAAARRMLDAAGLYGSRASVLDGETGLRLPPYLAELLIVTGPETANRPAGALREIFRVLRPYGGTAFLPESLSADLAAAVREEGIEGAEVGQHAGFWSLRRSGPLPGAGQWTHQYADPANTVVSADLLVRAPLGLLWFGGPSNRKILPRHGHGPNPQVAGGRLLIEGPDVLRAIDVYTGRLLWEAQLPGLGRHYNTTAHQPGANALGSNYVTLPDAIYALHLDRCLRLDPHTGRTVAEFSLPRAAAGTGAEGAALPPWGFLAVSDNVLLGGELPPGLGLPDFSPRELLAADRDPQRAADLRKFIESLRGFAAAAGPEDEPPSRFLARNLNRLLGEPRLAGMLPPELPDAAGIIALNIAAHLRARPGTGPLDTRLREMNRDLLCATCSLLPARERRKPGGGTWVGASSRRLAAMDRTSGKVLWQLEARQGFLHNAIAAGAGMVFCVDRTPPQVGMLRSEVGLPASPGRLAALDLETGRERWSVEGQAAFASWLAYSAEHDVLVQASRPSRDHLPEPGDTIAAHRGRDGTLLWRRELSFRGPPLLHGRQIVTQELALDLLTGESVKRRSPLTGVAEDWTWRRGYGCGTVLGSRHLLTFRSAAAGFLDLERDGGTASLGGFRSGCTSNMIVADGVLAAPDYTRTCTCGYQNQSSLGLVHDPDAETWAFTPGTWDGSPVRRVGINFGAPGDRRTSDGTLWLDWPSVGGESPDLPVNSEPVGMPPPDVVPLSVRSWLPAAAAGEPGRPADPVGLPGHVATFRLHSSELQGGGLKWVAASGLRDVRRLTVSLGTGDERRYTVRLHFCEPEAPALPRRIFDVTLQGRAVLSALDIAREAGGARRPLVREFRGVAVREVLEVSFRPAAGSAGAVISGLEAVVEE
jgi:outer membrane protein assembly factor BamB